MSKKRTKDKQGTKDEARRGAVFCSPVPGLENEAYFEETRVVQSNGGRHGGLLCHVCRNTNPRCVNCGGKGTPWLI